MKELLRPPTYSTSSSGGGYRITHGLHDPPQQTPHLSQTPMPEPMFSIPGKSPFYKDQHTRERAISYSIKAVTRLIEDGFPVRLLSEYEPYVSYVTDPCTGMDRMCFLIIMGDGGELQVQFGSIIGNWKESDEFTIVAMDPSIGKTVDRIVSGVKERYQAELDYLAKEEEIKNRRDAMASTLLELVGEFPEYKTLLSVGTEGTLIFNFESETEGAPEIGAILEALSSAKVDLPPCE